ncbi:MAG TPA: mannosyltransferase family protein [Solirubrobacteraceae bacterium]|nr:mannosyltransferase family protein [Solirubrobacteraceae bacterium]
MIESHATELPATRPAAKPVVSRRDEDVALRRAACALGGMLSIVLLVGVGSFAVLGSVPHGGFDPPGVVDHLGAVRDALAAPFARWDSVWYLTIARHGYTPGPSPAFFPLYPLLVAALGALGPGLLVGGVLISVAAMLVGLRLLWLLTDLELGAAHPDAADLAVFAVALGPMAFFFTAVYSESLYLALTLGAFLSARQERWARAGVLGALAAATRSSGLLVIVGLLGLWLEQRRPESRWARWPAGRVPGRPAPPPAGGRPAAHPGRRRDLLWIAVVPLGLLAYLCALALGGLPPLAPFSSQQEWFRHFTGPVGGVLEGARAAFAGARQLLSGQTRTVYYPLAGGDPMTAGWHNVMLFGFLVGCVPLVVGALRRLPLAYGLYALSATCLAISYPVSPQPLTSLPRYLVVLFPLPMTLGLWLARHPRLRLPVLGASAVSLAGFTELFATWHWIA